MNFSKAIVCKKKKAAKYRLVLHRVQINAGLKGTGRRYRMFFQTLTTFTRDF